MTAHAAAEPLPLSPAQAGVWLVEQLGDGSSVVSIDRAWIVLEPVRRAALCDAAQVVIRRHQALRTAIIATPEGPVQHVLDDAPCVIRELDDAESALASFFTQEWDLSRPPCLRMAVGPGATPGSELIAVRAHHALCDGASFGVVLADLAAAYRDALAGGAEGTPPVRESAAQFGDYVRDLHRRLDSADGDRALDHWRAVLAEPAAPLSPPADLPRPADRSHLARVTTFDLPADLTAALERVARGSRVSVPAVLLAGVVTMLGATAAGVGDVTVGVALASRGDGPCDLVGMTTNLVPVRTDLRVHRSVGELLRDLRQGLVGALDHGWMPHEAVLDRLRIPRTADQYPVFHVLVSLLDERGTPPFRLGRAPAQEVPAPAVGGARARTDVTIVLTRHASGIACRMDFDADLYSAARADRITSWLRNTLAALADQRDDQPLASVSPFTADERCQILSALSNVDSQYDMDVPTAMQAIADQAAANPRGVALIGGGGRRTYAELWSESAMAARGLLGLGARGRQRVGICLRRGPDMVAALLGVWRARGAYVPLDPDPPERLRGIITEASVEIVVADAGSARRVADAVPGGVRVVSFEDLADLGGHPGPALPPAPAPGELAYVAYPPGEADSPRGVLVEHRGIAGLIRWASSTHTADDLSGVLAAAPLYSPQAVLEIFAPLAAGGTVVLPDVSAPGSSAVPPGLARLVGGAPRALAGMVEADALPLTARVVTAVGTPLPEQLVTALYEHGIAEVRNVYAKLETSGYATSRSVDRDGAGPYRVGRPLDGTTAYVLDDRGMPVGVGVAGHLYIGGNGIARGYCGRPADTAAAFVPDPFRRTPGARMYRTGDAARWCEDSGLEVLPDRDATAQPAAPPAAAATGIAGIVAATWLEVLGRPVTDENRSFFEVGGTSLALVKVQALLKERGRDVRLAQLFRHPTIRSLAGYLAEDLAGRR